MVGSLARVFAQMTSNLYYTAGMFYATDCQTFASCAVATVTTGLGNECHFSRTMTQKHVGELLTVGMGLREGSQAEIRVENEYEEDFHSCC